MPKILLLIQQRGNRQLLGDWLSRNYQVAVGETAQDLNQPFDLAIVDTSMLRRLRPELRLRTSSELPVYLPVLLITSRQDTGALTSDVWSLVDELILAPIDPVELRARVEVLFRIRKDSLDLKRYNDELEVFISELTSAFEVAEDVTQLTDILLERALKIGGSECGAVVLVEGGQPRLASIRGDGLQHLLEGPNLASVIDRAGAETKLTPPRPPEGPEALDQAVMPILVNNQVAGAVVLVTGTGELDGSEQKLLNAVCAQAGVFLHNLQQAHRLVEAAHVYHQLDLAEAVQKQLLPVSKSGIAGFETAAFYQATNRVGGDYYDIIQIGSRQIAAVIADVAGHSLSSGLVMTAARSAFRVLLPREKSPAAVIEQLNRVLLPDLEQTGVFISMCLIVVDLESRTATYANAGHCSPMIFRAGQDTPISLEATGVPLGILDDAEYEEERIPLCEGDTAVLYTDGFTEARNAAGQFWGEEGMVECVVKGARGDPGSVSRGLVEGALRHSNNQLDDDLTVLVFRIKMDPSE